MIGHKTLLETSRTAPPMTQLQIPEALSPQQHRSENIKSS